MSCVGLDEKNSASLLAVGAILCVWCSQDLQQQQQTAPCLSAWINNRTSWRINHPDSIYVYALISQKLTEITIPECKTSASTSSFFFFLIRYNGTQSASHFNETNIILEKRDQLKLVQYEKLKQVKTINLRGGADLQFSACLF